MHIAIWLVTALLLGLWTVAAWGLAALLSTNGEWLVVVQPWLATVPFGGWLETWFPEWLQAAEMTLTALQSALAWLGGAVPVIIWACWGLGTLLLLLLAAGLSLLVAMIRKHTATPPASPPGSPGSPPVAAA